MLMWLFKRLEETNTCKQEILQNYLYYLSFYTALFKDLKHAAYCLSRFSSSVKQSSSNLSFKPGSLIELTRSHLNTSSWSKHLNLRIRGLFFDFFHWLLGCLLKLIREKLISVSSESDSEQIVSKREMKYVSSDQSRILRFF